MFRSQSEQAGGTASPIDKRRRSLRAVPGGPLAADGPAAVEAAGTAAAHVEDRTPDAKRRRVTRKHSHGVGLLGLLRQLQWMWQKALHSRPLLARSMFGTLSTVEATGGDRVEQGGARRTTRS